MQYTEEQLKDIKERQQKFLEEKGNLLTKYEMLETAVPKLELNQDGKFVLTAETINIDSKYLPKEQK